MKVGDIVLLLPPESGKGPLLRPGSSTRQLCKGRKFWRKIMAETRVWVVVKITWEKRWRQPEEVKSICARPLDRPEARLTKLPVEFVRRISPLELLALQAE